jgi:hypothetical protein
MREFYDCYRTQRDEFSADAYRLAADRPFDTPGTFFPTDLGQVWNSSCAVPG